MNTIQKIESPYFKLLLIGITMLVSYSYFFQAGGWNQNSRLDLTRAIVEEHRLKIDSYHENTGDKSLVGGHYYSDKAPGQSLLAVPFVVATNSILKFINITPASEVGINTLAYVATFFTSVLPTIVTTFLLYWLGTRMGYSRNSVYFMMISYSFATPAWCYATLLFPHALTGCLLLISLCAVVAHEKAKNIKSSFFITFIAGLSAGYMVLVDYHAGPAALLITLFLIFQVKTSKSSYMFSAFLGMSIGASLCIALLLTYNFLSFGSPFTLSYQVKVGFDEMQEGLFGVTYPRWESLLQLLFGQYRGLFPIAPVLLGSIYGFFLIIKDRKNRFVGIATLSISLYFILMHASFINWHSGWAYGPRYMLDALPLFCLPLAAVWMKLHRLLRTVLVALVIVGSVQSFVAVSVTPQAPQFYYHPFRDLYWPAFQHGEFSLNHQSYMEYEPEYLLLRHPDYGRYPKRASWNIGEKMGLKGHKSMLPLYSVWIIILFLYYWRDRKNKKEQ